jgi:OOP family OmpA-OmpF porin
MKTIRFITLTLLFVIAVNAISFSQTDKGTDKIKYNTWSATLSAGSMLFYGDLRQFDFYPVTIKNSKDWYNLSTGLSEYDRGFSLAVSKQLSPIFGVQGMLQKGAVNGIRPSVDAHFSASFLTYGFNLKVNFLPIFYPNLKAPKIALYGIAGIGLCDFKSMQTSLSSNSLIHSYGYGDFGQEKKNTTETVIPLGLGIKYKINKHFDLGVEATINNVNTDKLDARSVTGSARDKYGYTALTLTYQIGKNEKSLEWVTSKDMEADELTPLFNAINKKIDSLGNKLNELDGKVAQIQKDVADLKNPAKEADDDNDGVPNSKDLEPNTPAGNLVNFQGITIPKTGTGVAEVKPQFSIFFTVNSSYIDAINEEKIAAAAKMLKDDSSLKFEIVGHADKTGGQVYNDLLSKRRAQAVYDKLVKSYGIDASRLTVVGKGINEPLSSDILSVNRRVDFLIKK